jgi:hypothetical protein
MSVGAISSASNSMEGSGLFESVTSVEGPLGTID